MAGRIRVVEVFLDEDGFKKPEFICTISKYRLINVRKRVDDEEFEFTRIDKETVFVKVEEKDVAQKVNDKTMVILSIISILLTTAGIIFTLIQS